MWDQPGGVNIEKLFEHYDKDQDGWLSYSEWCRAVRRDGVAVGSGQHLTCAPTCFDPLSAKAASETDALHPQG